MASIEVEGILKDASAPRTAIVAALLSVDWMMLWASSSDGGSSSSAIHLDADLLSTWG